MTACVFLGPTLSATEVAADIVCLPPVAQGDVLRAVRRFAPRSLGIVDGLFGGAPAVWHKEILWALSEGVAVFGSASMGALRAAELHAFGMQGVGRIFEHYRDGLLEDDDEVALIHGPAELGYPALSEPMVNVRATLARAEREGVLDGPTRATLEASAKAQHFPQRTWPGVLDRCDGHVAPTTRRRFETWLTDHRVDQKRDDALEMLAAMRMPITASAPSPSFSFAATHHWNGLVSRADLGAESLDETARDVLDELRLGPQALLQSMQVRALLRRSVLEGSTAAGVAENTSGALRTALGLSSRDRFHAWLAANRLDAAEFDALAGRSQVTQAFASHTAQRLSADLLDEVRLSGDYPRLAARAHAKSAALSRSGNSAAPESRMALRQWFAASRLDGADADLPMLLDATGFENSEALDRALHRERLYLTLGAPLPDV